MKKSRKRKMRIRCVLLIVLLMIFFFISGCPLNNSKTQSFYLAGEIIVQSVIPVNVMISFYSSDCVIYYNSDGTVTDMTNFSSVGQIQKTDVVSQNTFQILIPEPYGSIGGILGWIDKDSNETPDPLTEEVVLLKRSINGVISVITGVEYDPTVNNFLISYENKSGSFQQYLSIIGNDNYSFNF